MKDCCRDGGGVLLYMNGNIRRNECANQLTNLTIILLYAQEVFFSLNFHTVCPVSSYLNLYNELLYKLG